VPERNQLEQLARRVDQLERRVAELERHAPTFVMPAPVVPSSPQMPPGSIPRDFNGLRYYDVPVARPQDK
jgi:hypothetical protein